MNIRQVIELQQKNWVSRAKGIDPPDWGECHFCTYSCQNKLGPCEGCPVTVAGFRDTCTRGGAAYDHSCYEVDSKTAKRLACTVVAQINTIARHYHLKQVPVPKVK